MDQNESSIKSLQKALKLLHEVDDKDKEEGFELLTTVLERRDQQLLSLGYHQVVFKELVKLAQFENGSHLRKTLSLLELHYFGSKEFLDELAQTLIFRVARSTDYDICKLCLESIASLINYFDDSIAKHSKQLIRLIDLNDMPDLNPLLEQILLKIEQKLPKRKVL